MGTFEIPILVHEENHVITLSFKDAVGEHSSVSLDNIFYPGYKTDSESYVKQHEKKIPIEIGGVTFRIQPRYSRWSQALTQFDLWCGDENIFTWDHQNASNSTTPIVVHSHARDTCPKPMDKV